LKKIVFILGTRPNLVKAAPVYHALVRRGNTPILIYTGQHHDFEMMGSFQALFELPDGISLAFTPAANTRSEYIASLSTLILKQLEQLQPEIVVVFGDVNSSLAGAIAAKSKGIKLVHVESGLRSGDLDMPEEHNRIEIDRLTDIYFVTEPSGVQHLLAEGADASAIHQCGNTMIDALRLYLPKAQEEKLLLEPPYIWCSLHRPANTDTFSAAQRSIDWVITAADVLPVFWPMHPRMRNNLATFDLLSVVTEHPRITVTPPQSYLSNLAHMHAASLLLTDSGGVQEEAVGLERPCITLRTTTERPVTIDSGWNVLLPEPTVEELKAQILRSLEPQNSAIRSTPAGWDGQAGERIAEKIANH
jgi:UDP-N-acetylglucosamine 2-epimerase (non-hydrolysing)